VQNVRFAGLPGQAEVDVNMRYPPADELSGMVINLVQKDQVYVYGYNGVSTDNFRVYYTQQAADFVVPQTQLNSWDGSPRLVGAPVAGLTNAQAWATYNVAIAGSVAPSAATTRAGIGGLVTPL